MRIFNLIWGIFFKKKEIHNYTPNSAFEMEEEKENNN